MFLEFYSKMPEAPLFYTADESIQRDRRAAIVIREIRAKNSVEKMQSPADDLGPTQNDESSGDQDVDQDDRREYRPAMRH